jgi:two-component system sensor histidine kinase/response regulator
MAASQVRRQVKMAPKGIRSEEDVPSKPKNSGLRSPVEPLPPLYRELLQSRGKLEQEVRQHTLTLATLAHEIKNPLAIISGYVELLLELKAGPLTDRQRRILEAANENCLRLRRLTQDFLSYSALEAGGNGFPVNFEMGDLNACLTEVCGYWVAKYAEKGVALFFQANPQIAHFNFDYYKVQQIVSNLVENALKFTGRGGSVWITAELHAWDRRRADAVHPKVERRKGGINGPNAVRVNVADTGVGIAGEFHQEIFDDFFRVSEGEDEPYGAGLGLAISRRLIQLHGGKIWVESEPGAGSKFSFLLPLNQPGE